MVALMVGASVLTPVACLGLLFWLARLEDTLVDDVRKVQRQPAPAPILVIPVQRRQPEPFTFGSSTKVQ